MSTEAMFVPDTLTYYSAPFTMWIFLISIIPILAFIGSTLSFTTIANRKGEDKLPPTVPYVDPLLGHAFSLAWDPASFIAKILADYGWQKPLKIYAAWIPLTMISNPTHIQTVFRSSKYLTSKPSLLFALKYLLNTPPSIIKSYARDDSGMAAKPNKGSTVEHADRIQLHQAQTARRFLSGQHLVQTAERYVATFKRNLHALAKVNTDDWVEFPDLYQFLQIQITRASIETIMGSKILEMSPRLIEDFWEFDMSVPQFTRCLPRWLMPSAYRARDRLLNSIKEWHAYAHANSDCSKTNDEDPEWEPYFGSKLIRARQEYSLKTSFMNADACASEDLGLMMASNSNAVTSAFWYIYESLRDTDLQKRMVSEVTSCTGPTGLDTSKLSTQPLLQSAYAEVLRLRIAIAMTRTNESDDFRLDGYRIPKGNPLIIFSRTSALNADAWTLAGRPPTYKTPLENFYAERFLVPKKSAETGTEYEFSLEGTAGCWLPYGGGERMCPGRHFAKTEIIGTFASLLSQYDLELAETDPVRVEADLRYYPTGGLPPKSKVPFRIRKKQLGGTDL
ncbi:cytochrome P450 [Annulohypoxylon bovei var. microspora]|nr:cytochrome P450 [Annulohypoxylon bovei var. microspora]